MNPIKVGRSDLKLGAGSLIQTVTGVVILLSAGIVGSSESARNRVLNLFFDPQERKLLATVTGYLAAETQLFTIAKYATRSGIILELYQASEEGGVKTLIDRVVIGDRRNAFWQFKGESIQLALIDITEDGRNEVVAPTFDNSLKAHLNVFEYDPELKRLFPLRSLP